MQIHNIRETIVAGASSSPRAECFDRERGQGRDAAHPHSHW